MIYNLAQLIQKTATLFPEKVAFRCLEESITYAELDVRTNQLAAFLISSGLQKGDRVGIYMNRCLETSVAVHGVLKAGGAFVAINPFSPHKRSITIMQDCGIEYVLSTPSQARKIKAIVKEAPFLKSIVGIEEIEGVKTISWEDIARRTLDDYMPPKILGKDLASILYTSGSTGVPKGIMHTHYSSLSLARLEADLHNSTHKDIIGNFAPLHFDQSLFGYFSGPLVGATTVIFPGCICETAQKLICPGGKGKNYALVFCTADFDAGTA